VLYDGGVVETPGVAVDGENPTPRVGGSNEEEDGDGMKKTGGSGFWDTLPDNIL
jgi:hypothetical protein